MYHNYFTITLTRLNISPQKHKHLGKKMKRHGLDAMGRWLCDPFGRLALPVSGAVHGLERVGLLLHLEGEHVLTVVLPVARGLPELAVVDVGRDYFLEAPLLVLTLPMVEKGVLFQKIKMGDKFEFSIKDVCIRPRSRSCSITDYICFLNCRQYCMIFHHTRY